MKRAIHNTFASVLGVVMGIQIREMSSNDDITWPLGLSVQWNSDMCIFSVVSQADTVGYQIKLEFASSAANFKLQWRYRWPTISAWKDF